MKFSPIAIVGQSCVLPGALNPEELWQGLVEGRNYLENARPEDWNFSTEGIVQSGAYATDKTPHAIGAFVRGFKDVFEPGNFPLDADFIRQLDPLFQWVLHCGWEALKTTSWKDSRKRTGVVLGNLSYPTSMLNVLAKTAWLKSNGEIPSQTIDQHNRFIAGYPSQLLSQALGLEGPSFCLDAACASSIYAIKNACDLLQNHEVDLAVSGGINAIDGAFLHLGFSALKALSLTGRCLPFSKNADGLIPSKGAAFVALRRLEDAERLNEPILGVIRGIGLSNDGRTGSLLSPSSLSQQDAIRRAYELADLRPGDISYVECHATATTLGDRCELESMNAVFGTEAPLVLGSVKANMGHLLAASGTTALIKVLASFKHQTLTPFAGLRDPIPQLLASSYQTPSEATPWDGSRHRRAALNAFGFGGNNAHLIVEEYIPSKTKITNPKERNAEPIAIVGLGVHWGRFQDKEALLLGLENDKSQGKSNPIQEFAIDIAQLHFPPNDLASILPQQLILIPTVAEALSDLKIIPSKNTGILVGIGTDSEACRFNFRLELLQRQIPFSHESLPPLDATKTLGCMPNIPANRFNLMQNWAGASYTVLGEELSGIYSLKIACQALRNHEIDCMIVAASDLSCEPVHEAAVRKCLVQAKQNSADGAGAIVLKRLADAQRDGDSVFALIGDESAGADELRFGDSLSTRFGHAHAASGLLNTIAGALALSQGAAKAAHIQNSSFSQTTDLFLRAAGQVNLQGRASLQNHGTQRMIKAHLDPVRYESPTKVVPQAPILPPILPTWVEVSQKKTVLFSRDDLQVHACGKLSEIFGEGFKETDGYHVRVRMPEPPLLLTDRILAIAAEKGSMGCGSITTETDIVANSWYLHNGRMQPGPAIEAGQADLFLISYLGVDFENKGERTYRLLGCEATFHRDLPKVGETLRFEITIDRHLKNGAARLFFFHYDCFINDELFLSVKEGQAGFFSQAELTASQGVIWEPSHVKTEHNSRPRKARVSERARNYSREQIQAFASGDAFACFGAGYEKLAFHTRTPSLPQDKMLLFDEIAHLDPVGGPWAQGYLRATRQLSPDDWFFQGHFTNDPCMPGTLMTEMAFQALSFFMAALGHTFDRDGFRFVPALGESCKLICRGQVTPESKHITLEVFVKHLDEDKLQTVADVLLTVDGLKALHAQNIAISLIPDWPVDELSKVNIQSKMVASFEGIRCDENQIANTVSGKPSAAWGPRYRVFDNGLRPARLPGAPYTYISRICTLNANYCAMEKRSHIIAEWDIPKDNPILTPLRGFLPFSVVLESILQPCGWLASYIGCPLASTKELFFRNLEGEFTLLHEPKFNDRIRTDVRVTSLVRMQDTIIIEFAITASTNDGPFAHVQTRFGYFTAEALADQKGIKLTPFEEKIQGLWEPHSAEHVSSDFGQKSLKVFSPYLHLLDTVQNFTLEDSPFKLGCLAGQKILSPQDWFFRAHFFQDPVMPGSLGLEAMLQLFKLFLLKNNDIDPNQNSRFALIEEGQVFKWKYRGQIIPRQKMLQVFAKVDFHENLCVRGEASLLIDGIKIYELSNASVGIVPKPNFN